MRTGNLIGRARDVGRVVVAVAWLVVAIREDGQVTFRVRCRQLRFRTRLVERLVTARIDLEVKRLLDGAADTLAAGVTLAGTTGAVVV